MIAGTRRSAVYTNLPPRSYRFLVEASTDEDGWTGVSSATVSFTVLPAFYQTGWFYGLCVLVAGAVVIGAWRLRVGMVRREYSAGAGRARAAQPRDSRHAAPEPGRRGAADGSRWRTACARPQPRPKETLLRTAPPRRGLRARGAAVDPGPPLAGAGHRGPARSAARRSASDITAESNLGFSLTVTGRPRRCPARLENELLRIGQEAIINAVRHAQASQIRLELRFESDAVSLKVLDDGRGFDAVAGAPRGRPATTAWSSMRERAENLGGRLHRSPDPASGGTEVEAVVPTSAAA